MTEEHCQQLGNQLWRDILSQVFLPTLEKVKVEVERNLSASNKGMAEHFTKTLQRMLSSMNKLIVLKQTLVTYYTDILCLFASGINNVELSQVVVDALRQVLTEVG